MITYRPALAADRAFIVSGWSSSYRESRDCTTPMAMYARHKHEEVESHISRVGAQVLVAETSVLAGFLCFETDARIVDELGAAVADYVFYVYVAQPFRKRGVARGLFRAAGIDPASRFHYACRTLSSWELRSETPMARYSPYYARYSPEENQKHERDHDREATRRKRYRGA